MSFIRQKWTQGYPVHKSRAVPDVTVTVQGDKTYNNLNQLQSTDHLTTATLSQKSETIAYTGGLPGHTRQSANWCVHKTYRRQYVGDPNQPLKVTLFSNGWHTDYFSVHEDHSSARHTQAETAFGVACGFPTGTGALSNAQGYYNQTYVKCRPDLTKFSLPNDLLDWDQMGDLAKVWRKNQSIVTNLAGAHLNYKFGWKPLIGDLNALRDGVLTMRDKITKFKKSTGRIISARCKILNDSTAKVGNITIINPNKVLSWRGQVDRTIYGYLVYQPLPIIQFGKIDEVLRGILDTTGFELNPRIIWDKIPFTFVVDWFVNVGEFLETYKQDALELPINVLQCFVQYKDRVQVNSDMIWRGDAASSWVPMYTPGCFSVSTCFTRSVGMPDFATLASLKIKTPSTNQIEELISLGTVLSSGQISTFTRKLDSSGAKLLRYFEYL